MWEEADGGKASVADCRGAKQLGAKLLERENLSKRSEKGVTCSPVQLRR